MSCKVLSVFLKHEQVSQDDMKQTAVSGDKTWTDSDWEADLVCLGNKQFEDLHSSERHLISVIMTLDVLNQ